MTSNNRSGGLKETSIKRSVRFLTSLLYQSVDVSSVDDEPLDVPTLSVSNHFGGFADPLLLLYAFDRRPLVIARDKIWKVPVAGAVMRWLESIPVHKREDGSRTSNSEMFSSAYAALHDRRHLLIFPEGITVDDPSIAPIKTGAARIALGAWCDGVRDLAITPVGIHYEDKALLRSRVFVNRGETIWLDALIDDIEDEAGSVDPSNREAVRLLTDEMERRLRAVAPNFTDWNEANALSIAAEVLVRSDLDDPSGEVSFADRERVAADLAHSQGAQRATLLEAVEGYSGAMDAIGLTDRELMARVERDELRGFIAKSAGLGVAIAPFAALGAAVNAPPYLGVKMLGLLPVAPAVKATIKPMGAIVLFGATWSVWSVLALRRFGAVRTFIAVPLLPIGLASVIVTADRLRLIGKASRSARAAGAGVDLQKVLLRQRDAVVAAARQVMSGSSSVPKGGT